MKNIEVSNLYEQLKSTDFNSIENTKFQYAIQRNIDKLESEVKSIQVMIERMKPPRYAKLQAEILPIFNEAVKAAQPEDLVNIEEQVLAKWDKADEWKKEADKYKKLIEELNEQENEFKPFTINVYVDNLNETQMKSIYKIINHEVYNRAEMVAS